MSPKLLNILLVLTPLVLYYGYLSPMYDGVPGFVWTPEASINVLKSQDVQYTNALNQVSLVGAEMDKINKGYLAVDSTLKDKVTMLLPDNLDPIKLRNEVTSIANDSGVALTGLQVGPSVGLQSKDLGSYSVSFSVLSHYSVFKKLIENFEKSTRLFVIDSVTIKHQDKKDDKNSSSGINDNETLNFIVKYNVSYLK